MGLAQPKNLYTPEEYLELERKSEIRHEYIDGEIFEMSGATKRHNQIFANIIRLLGNQILERNCNVYANDMRVKITSTGLKNMGLDIVELVIRIEEEFEIGIPNEIAETFVTSRNIIDYLISTPEIRNKGMTRENIKAKILEMVEDEQGLYPDEFDEDSRFVEDLSMD